MIELEFEQGSREWHQARAGRVTGTSLSSAVGTPAVQKTLMYELVAERMTEVEIIELNTFAVLRGQELEPYAIKAAAEVTGINYDKCGMLISTINDMFGFSPDAVYRENGIIVGGLEVKCPASKTHVKYLLADEVPKEYWWQVLAPFVASDDVQWWDFASYDDRNYHRPLFITRVNRASIESEILPAREKLCEFLDSVKSIHEGLTF